MESARNSLVLGHLSRLAKLDSIESYLCDIIRAGPRGTGGINYPFCPISDTPGVDQLNQCASEGGFIRRRNCRQEMGDGSTHSWAGIIRHRI
ncbi:hypothetical protein NPIL_568511 [Nephila pilipes]|uniref:Uncharacterized protein n=1 Tax=Nephila pilipes TaxID=299642 RepID=A0A8X6MQK8_NEPPI|nr:hypothetical protein NPIL_568511 [Nephila pilipes]